jgi:replicative DNA helicase
VGLLRDEPFTRKVIPFLKGEYFLDKAERLVFQEISSFLLKYNSLPSATALLIEIDNNHKISQTEMDSIQNCLDVISSQEDLPNMDWLVDNTEQFCKDKAMYNAIMEAIQILDSDNETSPKESIPDLMKGALSVSFDTHVGHDYLEDFDERFEFYNHDEEHLPFDLEYFNKITNGGIYKKTLNILMAGPGAGKTLAMCHFAASYLTQGKNVLYITLEMAEEWISHRIDANLLNVGMNDIKDLPKVLYNKKVEKVRNMTDGKLIVKEYPTAQAGVGHFRHLLNELNLKKNFIPDVIFVDYLNLCTSVRIKPGGNLNSYNYIKSIAEELRGFAVERLVPIISATQLNREGFSSSDVGMENTAESFGLPATADLFLALITSDELEELGQIMVKQLKNRYNDITKDRKFVVGIDRMKMRLFDCEQSAQEDIISETTTQPHKKKDFSSLIIN